jgi:release factor glutamine methyltransferase
MIEARYTLGGSDSPALDAELLLAEALGVDRARLYFDSEQEVAEETVGHYRRMLAARADGQPIAYLLGRREFWSLTLEVTPATLVPRPDTELLVEAALDVIRGRHHCRVADLGTGTGAIALALATERPDIQVLATDVSRDALAVAARNAARLGLTNLRLAASDWYEDLGNERFDLIVSNPPYVRSDYPDLVHGDLRHEPRSALEAGADGLAALRRIIAGAPEHLEDSGHVMVEHGFDQGSAVRTLMHEAGLLGRATRRDLAGHERVTGATWRTAGGHER